MKKIVYVTFVILLVSGCATSKLKEVDNKKILTKCPDQWVTNEGVKDPDPNVSRERFLIDHVYYNAEDFENGIEWVKKNCVTPHYGLD